MLHTLLTLQTLVPDWLQSPQWLVGLSEAVKQFIHAHEAIGLFVVIGAEELGVPLPVPGDIAILWAGYLTKIHKLSYPAAFACVVLGATLGSTVLFSLSRRVGHAFVVRYGRHVGVDDLRLRRAERAFLRYGAAAIVIGRLIPGFRIVISAFAGTFNVPYAVFVPSVMGSAMIWAVVFLELGRYLGPSTVALFRVLPAHLLPVVLLALLAILLYAVARQRGRERRPGPEPALPDMP